MNENIVKPMSVVKQELFEQLINDVNNSGLPLFVIEYILQDMLVTVRNAARQQYEMEKVQYEQMLKQQKEE